MVRSLMNALFPPVTLPAQQRWPRQVDGEIVYERWQPDGQEDYCPRCGSTTGPGEVTGAGCRLCCGRKLGWDRFVRLGVYEPPLAFWIRLFKYHGKWGWGRWMGGHLARALPEAVPRSVLLVPVPLHWSRQWARGYNQAELVAGEVARVKGWPMERVLRRRRGRPQVSLAAHERAGNVKGKFALRRGATKRIAGRDVWLIDDVKTTGATLRVCARLLREGGARSVQVAVVGAAAEDRGRARKTAKERREAKKQDRQDGTEPGRVGPV